MYQVGVQWGDRIVSNLTNLSISILIAETRFTLYPPLAFALPNLELLAAT